MKGNPIKIKLSLTLLSLLGVTFDGMDKEVKPIEPIMDISTTDLSTSVGRKYASDLVNGILISGIIHLDDIISHDWDTEVASDEYVTPGEYKRLMNNNTLNVNLRTKEELLGEEVMLLSGEEYEQRFLNEPDIDLTPYNVMVSVKNVQTQKELCREFWNRVVSRMIKLISNKDVVDVRLVYWIATL